MHTSSSSVSGVGSTVPTQVAIRSTASPCVRLRAIGGVFTPASVDPTRNGRIDAAASCGTRS